MKPEYKVIEAHYGNLTAYRVVKSEDNDPSLTTVHIYNNECTANTVAELLNSKLGGNT